MFIYPKSLGMIKWLNADPAQACCASDVLLHSKVSIFSPRCAPRVLHNPIMRGRVVVVSNYRHAMVQICPACASENSTRVKLEGNTTCFNGYRNRLDVDGIHERTLTVGCDVYVTSDGNLTVSSFNSVASALCTLVWIVR